MCDGQMQGREQGLGGSGLEMEEMESESGYYEDWIVEKGFSWLVVKMFIICGLVRTPGLSPI